VSMGGGAYRGVRKAGVEGQWELARVERGVKKARTGFLRRGRVVVGVVNENYAGRCRSLVVGGVVGH
jgi:hypothetical protein